jgi:thiamine kinase-like enzyme
MDGRFQLSDCQIERIKYKPGQNCLIVYKIVCSSGVSKADRFSGSVANHQLLTARIYESGGSLSRFKRAQTEHLIRPLIGSPLLHLPDLDMVAWAFPNDRKLDNLPELADLDCLRQVLLPPLVAAVFGPGWRITSLEREIAHYNPEHTCMVRVSVEMRHHQTGEAQTRLFYGKTYYDHEGAQTYYLMRQLWESQTTLRIAQPLAYDARRRILWQMGLSGRTLLADAWDDPSFLTWLQKAGAAVATLHQTPLTFPEDGRSVDWLAELQTMGRLLPQVRPSCYDNLEKAVHRLLEQAHYLDTEPVATLHGDLHLGNFFITPNGNNNQIALIDLDNLHPGSPWKDVGSFIAGLLYRGLLLEIPDALTRQAVSAFCESYRQHVPWPLPQAALNWYTAAALINERTFRCVTRLKDGRLDIVERLVQLALQLTGTIRYSERNEESLATRLLE